MAMFVVQSIYIQLKDQVMCLSIDTRNELTHLNTALLC